MAGDGSGPAQALCLRPETPLSRLRPVPIGYRGSRGGGSTRGRTGDAGVRRSAPSALVALRGVTGKVPPPSVGTRLSLVLCCHSTAHPLFVGTAPMGPASAHWLTHARPAPWVVLALRKSSDILFLKPSLGSGLRGFGTCRCREGSPEGGQPTHDRPGSGVVDEKRVIFRRISWAGTARVNESDQKRGTWDSCVTSAK